MIFFILFIVLILSTITIYQYNKDINSARSKLISYNTKTFESSMGLMTYFDEDSGEAILISHGIFGGYDQGYVSLNTLVGESYRKISISRFGYFGSDLPDNPSPQNQAKIFKELLDELKIDRVYILGTSAGGVATLQFALKYPGTTKGVILLASGAPDEPRTREEIKELGAMGPPSFIVNNFPMWFSLKHFSFIYSSMFGSDISNTNLMETMLPVKERREGIITDTEITNIDMMLNYNDYPLEKIISPVLVLHAKDDPMASYENIKKLIDRISDVDAVIYETGGHLLEGHNASLEIIQFIEKQKKDS